MWWVCRVVPTFFAAQNERAFLPKQRKMTSTYPVQPHFRLRHDLHRFSTTSNKTCAEWFLRANRCVRGTRQPQKVPLTCNSCELIFSAFSRANVSEAGVRHPIFSRPRNSPAFDARVLDFLLGTIIDLAQKALLPRHLIIHQLNSALLGAHRTTFLALGKIHACFCRRFFSPFQFCCSHTYNNRREDLWPSLARFDLDIPAWVRLITPHLRTK